MEGDNLQTMLVVNAIIVWAIQAMKKSKYLPWFTHESQTANKLLSAGLAALASAGIVFSAAHMGEGHWTITITGLTAANGLHFLADAVGNYATQKGLYKVFTLSNNGGTNGTPKATDTAPTTQPTSQPSSQPAPSGLR